MSPPDSTGEPDADTTLNGNPGKSSTSDGLMTSKGIDVQVVDSLGEALAGVSLISQTTSNLGSSALQALATGTSSTNPVNDGWGNFAETAASGSSVFPSSGSIAAPSGTSSASNDSIHRFLSQDPSHTLGEDVFRLSHPNLPSLNYEQAKSDSPGAFRLPGQSMRIPQSNKNGFGEIRPLQETRRTADSPSGTGTTASSRSASPYANGDVVNGSRTIPAYQPYEPISDSGSAFARKQSSFGEDDRPGSNFGSLAHTHGSHSNLTGIDRSPYVKERSYATSAPYDQSLDLQGAPFGQADPNQSQSQVLYMAVPSPDGRGQVLQPVQMLQVPGKPYTYVVPGSGKASVPQAAGYFQSEAPQSMMVLPPLPSAVVDYGMQAEGHSRGYANDTARPYGPVRTEDFSRGAQYQADTALPQTFTSPQRPPLDALLGQVRRLSRDQVGCRLVQQALDEEGPMAATLILNEGLPFWGEAMVDPFGNYLFQKILEKITPEERVMLVKSVSTRLVNASLNLHGTRSVQKVVELCAQDEQEGKTDHMEESAASILTSALAPAAARLCIDSHGNHVIQRILLKLGPKHSKFVFDAVAASVGDVARHRHGCCVIQRCLDSSPNEARSHLVCKIVEKALELMQDAYGNYVVQYVLDVCSDEDVHAVCESVVGKVNLLAIQKFSSNVMEKCLERCSDRVKELYMQEMSDPDRIRELMMDPFGNYVVQRALSVATHAQAIRLVEAMRPHLIATQSGNGQRNGGVRNTAGGRRIIAKICRRFPNFTLNPVGSPDELYSQNKGSRHHIHHHHHQQPAVIQSFAAVGGPVAPSHHFATDPRLAHLPPQQPQQQPFYGLGGTGGYYDPFSSGHGSY